MPRKMKNCVGPLRVWFVRLGKPVETLMTLLFLVIKKRHGVLVKLSAWLSPQVDQAR